VSISHKETIRVGFCSVSPWRTIRSSSSCARSKFRPTTHTIITIHIPLQTHSTHLYLPQSIKSSKWPASLVPEAVALLPAVSLDPEVDALLPAVSLDPEVDALFPAVLLDPEVDVLFPAALLASEVAALSCKSSAQ
jgi:hypothetical protein